MRPRADPTGLIAALGVAAARDGRRQAALGAEPDQRLPPARVAVLGHALRLSQQVQHELAEVVVARPEGRPDVRRAAQPAPQGAIVAADPGEPPGAGTDRPNQDAADQDLLPEICRAVGTSASRAAAQPPQPRRALEQYR
jgi:hypothetical protein